MLEPRMYGRGAFLHPWLRSSLEEIESLSESAFSTTSYIDIRWVLMEVWFSYPKTVMRCPDQVELTRVIRVTSGTGNFLMM